MGLGAEDRDTSVTELVGADIHFFEMRASHSFVLDISWQCVHKHMLLTDGGRHNWDFYHNIFPMLPSCTREAKIYGLVQSITAG